MNRPYYALAALLAVLCGSAVAVGPARCQSTTAGAAVSSRSLCGTSTCSLMVASNLFAHFEAGLDAGVSESFSESEQGSDDNVASAYYDSCGYDPYRGERYDAETSVDSDVAEPVAPAKSEVANDDNDIGTFAEECTSHFSDERIDDCYSEFEQRRGPGVCGGAEMHCPYYSGQAIQSPCHGSATEEVAEEEVADDELADSHVADEAAENLGCEQAYDQWLVEQNSYEQCLSGADFANEATSSIADQGEAWKSLPVETPEWIAEYLQESSSKLEEEYAEAELQAAREARESVEAAAQEFGPSLPAAHAPDQAAYDDEYESLFDLDKYLAEEMSVDDTAAIEETGTAEETAVTEPNGPVVWSLGRIFGKLYRMFDEILPAVKHEAGEFFDSADGAIQQWNAMASQLVLTADEVANDGCSEEYSERYSNNGDDAIFSHGEQFVPAAEIAPSLPVETAESREWIGTLAGGLRLAGQLLLVAADGLEAEIGKVLSASNEAELSASNEEDWSR